MSNMPEIPVKLQRIVLNYFQNDSFSKMDIQDLSEIAHNNGNHHGENVICDYLVAKKSPVVEKSSFNFGEMMDPVKYHMVRFMTVSDFTRLCKVDTLLSTMRKDMEIWKEFVERDFKMQYRGKEPEIDYFIMRKIHNWMNMSIYSFSKTKKSSVGDNFDFYWTLLDLANFKLNSPLVIQDGTTIQEKRMKKLIGVLKSFDQSYLLEIYKSLQHQLDVWLQVLLKQLIRGKNAPKSVLEWNNSPAVTMAMLDKTVYERMIGNEYFAVDMIRDNLDTTVKSFISLYFGDDPSNGLLDDIILHLVGDQNVISFWRYHYLCFE